MSTTHTRLSLSLNSQIHDALLTEATEERTDLNDLIQRVLGRHVIEGGRLTDSVTARLRTFWELVDVAKQTAIHLCDTEGPSSDITLRTFEACASDPKWLSRYEAYIGAPARSTGVAEKGALNREIGFRVREALDAEVSKLPSGTPEMVKVKGGLIQSYTRFRRVAGKSVV